MHIMCQTRKKVLSLYGVFLILVLVLLTACGANANSGSTTSVAAATATACAHTTRPATAFSTVSGILKSSSGQTLILTTIQAKDITITYSSATIFTQQTKIVASALKEGSSVRVAVTLSGSTYTAVTVQAASGTGLGSLGGNGTQGSRRGGFGGSGASGSGNPCFANRGRPGTGTAASNFRGLLGTVSQVNGAILTIVDSAGASYTVTLTTQTQIIETKSATAAALKAGEPLTVVGKPGGLGAITASSVAILLALPTRGGPTATPGA